jgi:hypothetical protein
LDPVDARERRRSGAQSGEEVVDRSLAAAEADADAIGVVPDLAVEAAFPGETIDERAEADALDDPADPDLGNDQHVLKPAFGHRRSSAQSREQ